MFDHGTLPSLTDYTHLTVLSSNIQNVTWELRSVYTSIKQISKQFLTIEAYYHCLDMEPEAQSVSKLKYERLSPGANGETGMSLEFRDVTVTYDGAVKPALDSVSFSVAPGQLVAIVGHNGSGKSTLISTLSLTLHPEKGEILVNGTDIHEYAKDDILRRMGFTFQTSPALPFTIREYISLSAARSGIDEDLAEKALVNANAADFVSELGEGWHAYPAGSVGTITSDGWLRPQVVPTVSYPPAAKVKEVKKTKKIGKGGQVVATDPSSEEKLEDAKEAKVEDEVEAKILETLDIVRDDLIEGGEEDNECGVEGTRPEKEDVDTLPTEEGGEKTMAHQNDTEGGKVLTLREKLDVKEVEGGRSLAIREDPDGTTYQVTFPEHQPSSETLSGGQWQKIAVARSLANPDNDLICFDEPAASLDPASEAALFNSILELKGKATILFSTHRYAITAKADLILMFVKGKLVEQGTHDDLMKIEGGEYRRMYQFSAQGFHQEPEAEDTEEE
ncbi:P-loop containing nucleoside triphosphate hydrolase protein [Meredithblackwellia eburnea MCA 4105]